jgi:calcineurin-like phosphoesterase family protein
MDDDECPGWNSRPPVRFFVLLFGLTLLAVSLPQAAAAESNVTLVPASGAAGTRASLLGRDFGKRDRVVVRVGRRVVARARTSRRGSFRVSFTVPDRRGSRSRVVSRSAGRRIVNLFHVSAASGSPSVGEVASRTGGRLRWAPVGGAIRLRGSHFPPRRRLRIDVSGREVGKARTDRKGRFSTLLTAPSLTAGRHLVRVKLRSRGLGFLFTPLTSAAPAVGPPVAPATAPSTGAEAVIHAAGDIACAPGDPQTATKCRAMKTSDIIVNGGAAKVLALGDLQYNSASLSNLRASYDRSWGRVKSITRPALGNHEGSGTGYFDYFNGSGASTGPAGERGKGYYSYDVGGWHLVALNSNCTRVACNAGSAQMAWLRADLSANPRACTLAYWHHPRFSSGHDGDGTFMQDIWKALYDANADLVVVGHSHNYERFAPMNAGGTLDRARGMREFVVGTGGAFFTGVSGAKPNSEVRQNSTYGVLKLTLRSTSYDWRFVPEAGKSFSDTGSQVCH